MAPGSSLDELRARLAAIDRRVLELAAERAALSAEVGRAKIAAGLPTRNFAQERQVLERTRGAAEQLGLDPELARSLLLLLIESSLTVQERGRLAAGAGGDGRRALVIGGGGRMGGWFVGFLASQGFAVEVADPRPPEGALPHRADWRQGPLDHDLIVVAAPLAVSRDILVELAGHGPPGLVFDVASLKGPLREGHAALVAAGVRATSLHPMFGPGAEMLSGRHVVFVEVGCAEATEQARQLFAPTMATAIDMELEDHDRVISYVLGLSHATSLAFVAALADSGESAPRLAEISSTTFDRQLELSRQVASENPHLYFEIQHLNDYGGESLAALLLAVERLRSVVRAGDEEGFVRLMERCRRYVAGRQGE